MLEQIPTTVPQQPKKPCKNDRKTMLKKQALARYNFFLYFYVSLYYPILLALEHIFQKQFIKNLQKKTFFKRNTIQLVWNFMCRPRLVGFAFCQLLSDKKLYHLPAIPEKIAKFFVNDFLKIKLERFFLKSFAWPTSHRDRRTVYNERSATSCTFC